MDSNRNVSNRNEKQKYLSPLKYRKLVCGQGVKRYIGVGRGVGAGGGGGAADPHNNFGGANISFGPPIIYLHFPSMSM